MSKPLTGAAVQSSAARDALRAFAPKFIDLTDNVLFGDVWERPGLSKRDAFAKTTDDARRKEIATAIQLRVSEYPTHAHLGQYNIPMARRKNVTGNLESPVPVFWNIKKN
jgi:peptide/nickel transport system substrate-binding protein